MIETPATPDTDRARKELIDKWYLAFDQRPLTVGTQNWPAVVSGIHVRGSEVWIQISHAEDPGESFVLHVSRDTPLEAAVAAARSWLPHRRHGQAVHVTR